MGSTGGGGGGDVAGGGGADRPNVADTAAEAVSLGRKQKNVSPPHTTWTVQRDHLHPTPPAAPPSIDATVVSVTQIVHVETNNAAARCSCLARCLTLSSGATVNKPQVAPVVYTPTRRPKSLPLFSDPKSKIDETVPTTATKLVDREATSPTRNGWTLPATIVLVLSSFIEGGWVGGWEKRHNSKIQSSHIPKNTKHQTRQKTMSSYCSHPMADRKTYHHEGSVVCGRCAEVLAEGCVAEFEYSDGVCHDGRGSYDELFPTSGVLASTTFAQTKEGRKRAATTERNWKQKYDTLLIQKMREVRRTAEARGWDDKKKDEALEAVANEMDKAVQAEANVRRGADSRAYSKAMRVASTTTRRTESDTPTEPEKNLHVGQRQRVMMFLERFHEADAGWSRVEPLLQKAKTTAMTKWFDRIGEVEDDEEEGGEGGEGECTKLNKFQTATIAAAAWMSTLRSVGMAETSASVMEKLRVVLRGCIDYGRSHWKWREEMKHLLAVDGEAKGVFKKYKRLPARPVRGDDSALEEWKNVWTVWNRYKRCKSIEEIDRSVTNALKAVIPCMQRMGVYQPPNEEETIRNNVGLLSFDFELDVSHPYRASKRNMRWIVVAVDLYRLMVGRKVFNGNNPTPYMSLAIVMAIVAKRRALAIEHRNAFPTAPPSVGGCIHYDPERPGRHQLTKTILADVVGKLPFAATVLKPKVMETVVRSVLERWNKVVRTCRDATVGPTIVDEFSATEIEAIDGDDLLSQFQSPKRPSTSSSSAPRSSASKSSTSRSSSSPSSSTSPSGSAS